jgi:type II secretion system protein H
MISQGNHRPGRTVAGFSLLELLVVLILLGFVAALAGPSVGHFMNTLAFKKQTGRVMAVIRFARLVAVTEGTPVMIQAAEDSHSFTFSGAINKNRDLGLGEDDMITLDPEIIRFSPDGHATPGTITFTMHGISQEIMIDPLSGLPVLKIDDE